MSIFQNINIRYRFSIITATILIFIFFILSFFIFTLNKIKKYNNYKESVTQLKIDYINMRRYEQNFLLRYNEDVNFFITGNNLYIKKHKEKAINVSKTLTSLTENPITKELSVLDILNEIETIHDKYVETFEELTQKIYRKGSPTSGIVESLITAGENSLKKAPNSIIKNKTQNLIKLSNKYLISKRKKDFSTFLKKYEELTNQQVINNDTTNNNIQSKSHIQSLYIFKKNFSTLVKLNKEIGVTYKDGLKGRLRELRIKPIKDIISIVNKNKQDSENRLKINIFILVALISVLILFIFSRFSKSISSPLRKLKNIIEPLSVGVLPKSDVKLKGSGEISQISSSINNLVKGLKKTTNFALSIGKEKQIKDYKPLSKDDTLGNALLRLQENLVLSKKEEEKRKEEDNIRTWANVGLTKFNDLLRQKQGNITEMSIVVISELVKFINANQGGMFVLNDEEDKLELVASYAYGHEKKKQKEIILGEGIVGTVALEKETVYMTDIPNSYITITSGLGESNPRSLLITPMIVDEKIVGVIELASFNKLKDYEITFVETLSENIASSLLSTKINQKTALLFEQSKNQTEMMALQEEEMRKNFEQLQKIQEDSSRAAAEMSSILNAIDSSSIVFKINLEKEIISANDRFLMLTNVPENEIVGKKHSVIFNENKNLNEYEAFWEMLLSKENVQKNEHLIVGDFEFWLSIVYTPIVDVSGTILYIFCVGTDLSESKKLEQKLIQNIDEIKKAKRETERKQHILENTNEMLKQNEKTLHSAVEVTMRQRKELSKKVVEIAEKEARITSRLEGINQTNITMSIGLDGEILDINKRCEELFGYKKEEISKVKDILTKTYYESEEFKNSFEQIKSGTNVSGTFEFIGKQKQRIFLQGTFTAIKESGGKTAEIYFVAFDITELIIKTEELKARETELKFKIEDLDSSQKEK